MAASLNGRVLAFVESRMPEQMASLVQRHGGVPYSAPVLEEIYLKDSPEVQQLVADVCGGQVDVVLLLTGVGTRALIETAASMGRQEEFIDSLNRLQVIARSPKPASVLRQHKIHIDVMPPEPFTSEDLVQAITGLELQGQEVAVQKYGGPNSFLLQSLRERGAKVREVTLYTWGLPADRTPALGLIDALVQGQIDSLAFTSQPQVGNLLTIAKDAGKEEALRESLNGPVVVASVGPVCSRRLRDAGIKIDVEPEHPHMGNLVLAVAEHFERQMAIS
ncbi:MAG: uroporphyrinogen-III synthase [Chloroflexi bacterium]|nr:uroporphyrinogen-III synthase [Chloroflexota bacterium]MDA1219789.1 uroporphyrinogen-III synthase [Chloroflexota bacterium]